MRLVSHTAGQGDDALDFLSLQELAFQVTAFAHVPDNAGQVSEFAAGVKDRRDGQRHLDQPAILATIGQFALPDSLSQNGLPETGIELRRLQPALEQPRRLTEHLLPRIAGHLFERAIDVDQGALPIGHHDAVAGRLQRGEEHMVGLLKTVASNT